MELLLKIKEILSSLFFFLTGPILDKELRVLSRRKRYYALRFCYTALLAFFVLILYLSYVTIGSMPGVVATSMMPQAGRTITITIIWFQFLASQLLTVTFLSTSISEEIYKRTLGVLMTTPINSLQIVSGKLLSRLLAVFLLLGISVPILAIIRVLGGVPWDYVISSFYIIMCAALFAGSVSMFFSIFSRQAFAALARIIIFFLVIYVLLPLGWSIVSTSLGRSAFNPHLLYFNPFAVLGDNTSVLQVPGSAGMFSWRIHCLIMLVASVFFFGLSTIFVRRAGLQQMGGRDESAKSLWTRKTAIPFLASSSEVIKPVKGPPLIWKDTRVYLSNSGKLKSVIFNAVFIFLVLAAYLIFIYAGLFEEVMSHVGFVCVFMLVGMWRTVTISASSITSEREARTWEILMTAPLTDKQIVLSKMAVSIFPAIPYFVLIFGHIIFFGLLGKISPAVILPLIFIIVFSFFLLSSAGVMFSCLFRRTVWSVGFALFMLVFIHFCSPCSFFANPLFLTGAILYAASGEGAGEMFPGNGYEGIFMFIFIGIGVLVFYFLAGFTCYAIARSQLRRKIYA